MKLILLFITMVIISTATAYSEKLYDWPKPKYPTEKIGSFMNFCIGAMNMRKMQEGVVDSSVVDTHARVCSCIMDQFRLNNKESVFDREFKASRVEGVPNFSKYLRTCGDISNNQMIYKFGT